MLETARDLLSVQQFVGPRRRGSRVNPTCRLINNADVFLLRVSVRDKNHVRIYIPKFIQAPCNELALAVAGKTIIEPKAIQFVDIVRSFFAADA